MKKTRKTLMLSLILAFMATFYGCKKNSDLQPEIPTLTTTPASLITTSSVTAGGTIIHNVEAEVTNFGGLDEFVEYYGFQDLWEMTLG